MKAISDKIKRKIHRIRKGSTVYAEVRKNLYDAVEQRIEFKEVRWDSKGRCHIAENYPGDYRGMFATIQPKAEGKSGSVVFFTLMMYSPIRDSSKPFNSVPNKLRRTSLVPITQSAKGKVRFIFLCIMMPRLWCAA